MSADHAAIDTRLANALRGGVTGAAPFTESDDHAAILTRIRYHGIAGLLRETSGAMAGWPGAVANRVGEEAVAQAMWELRHRQLLNALLAELATAGVAAVLLKGTALAYDLYAVPSTRTRGDSDLVIDSADLATARQILDRLGFVRFSAEGEQIAFALQEIWSQTAEGDMDHSIDLHWHLLNCPALDGVLPVSECLAHRVALPRLGPDAMGLDRIRTLIHTCIHRMLNFSSPYFVGERTYYGGDRLIWLNDIDLLARALSDAEWDRFAALALDKGVAAACLDGVRASQRFYATPIPAAVEDSLAGAPRASRPAAYLRARQFGRAWQDLQAIPGVRRKYGYLLARALPSAKFVRDKYPRQAGLPLPLLYARRLFDLVRPRPIEGVEP